MKGRPTPETKAEHLLWNLYPRHDGFIRRRQFSYSAEIVRQGQAGPPWATDVVAEAMN